MGSCQSRTLRFQPGNTQGRRWLPTGDSRRESTQSAVSAVPNSAAADTENDVAGESPIRRLFDQIEHCGQGAMSPALQRSLRRLYESDADCLTKPVENGRTLMHQVVKYGDVTFVKSVLDLYDQEANLPFQVDRDGFAPIHMVAARCQQPTPLETMRAFVSSRHIEAEHLQRETNGGWTPLLLAAWVGSPEGCRLLLEEDADVNYVSSRRGDTALHVAATQDHNEALKMLCKYSPDIDAPNALRETPLGCALKYRAFESALTLIENDADVQCHMTKAHLSYSPLHFVVRFPPTCHNSADYGEWMEVLVALLERGANVNAHDSAGRAVMEAIVPYPYDHQCDVLRILRQLDPVIESHGRLLASALNTKNVNVFRRFVEYGLDVNDLIIGVPTNDVRYPHELRDKTSVAAYLLYSTKSAAFKFDCLEILAANGADLDFRRRHGEPSVRELMESLHVGRKTTPAAATPATAIDLERPGRHTSHTFTRRPRSMPHPPPATTRAPASSSLPTVVSSSLSPRTRISDLHASASLNRSHPSAAYVAIAAPHDAAAAASSSSSSSSSRPRRRSIPRRVARRVSSALRAAPRSLPSSRRGSLRPSSSSRRNSAPKGAAAAAAAADGNTSAAAPNMTRYPSFPLLDLSPLRNIASMRSRHSNALTPADSPAAQVVLSPRGTTGEHVARVREAEVAWWSRMRQTDLAFDSLDVFVPKDITSLIMAMAFGRCASVGRTRFEARFPTLLVDVEHESIAGGVVPRTRAAPRRTRRASLSNIHEGERERKDHRECRRPATRRRRGLTDEAGAGAEAEAGAESRTTRRADASSLHESKSDDESMMPSAFEAGAAAGELIPSAFEAGVATPPHLANGGGSFMLRKALLGGGGSGCSSRGGSRKSSIDSQASYASSNSSRAESFELKLLTRAKNASFSKRRTLK